jgi:hypothetical protein
MKTESNPFILRDIISPQQQNIERMRHSVELHTLENIHVKAYGISYETAKWIIQTCPKLKTLTLDRVAIFPEQIELLIRQNHRSWHRIGFKSILSA